MIKHEAYNQFSAFSNSRIWSDAEFLVVKSETCYASVQPWQKSSVYLNCDNLDRESENFTKFVEWLARFHSEYLSRTWSDLSIIDITYVLRISFSFRQFNLTTCCMLHSLVIVISGFFSHMTFNMYEGYRNSIFWMLTFVLHRYNEDTEITGFVPTSVILPLSNKRW